MAAAVVGIDSERDGYRRGAVPPAAFGLRALAETIMKIPTARSVFLAVSLLLLVLGATSHAQAAPVRNIVLVHGAWVTGAGWKPVYDILVKAGYRVSVAQHPLTSVADDVSAVKRVLALQDGPTILVGHSYGGALITEAGNDSHVVGLVYVAAHALDEGETEAANGKRFPNATKAIKKTDDGYTYLDPAHYHADFASDLPQKQAEFEAHAQALTAAAVFTTPATQPAWKTKPSWYAVAESDRIINPDLQRMYAKRAHSRTIEVKGASHSVYESHPKEVAALIVDAATHAMDSK
jgi:pimeloyl-ACP methyl ester carboxylesterase